MKPPRTDITAGDAAKSAATDIVSALFAAWVSTSLPYVLVADWSAYDFPEWSYFNPLVTFGKQALAAAKLWGLPFAAVNLFVTWRLIFHSADRMWSAIGIAASTTCLAVGGLFEYTYYWENALAVVWSMVAVTVLVSVIVWRRCRRSE